MISLNGREEQEIVAVEQSVFQARWAVELLIRRGCDTSLDSWDIYIRTLGAELDRKGLDGITYDHGR